MYKLPHSVTEHEAAKVDGDDGEAALSGYNYLYFDSDAQSDLSLSPHSLGQGAGALHNTLDQIFTAAEKPRSEVGWLLYNDEMPYTLDNNRSRGHCKGILAFDKKNNSGIWVLHSTPRFPVARNPNFPSDEHIYAQTFIGITLDSYETACLIATQLHNQQQPQVYAYKLPDSTSAGKEQDAIYRLCCGKEAHGGALASHIAFKSKAGMDFQSIAKNRHWGHDFWIDLVGPTLKTDLQVESWRRGKVPSDEDKNDTFDVVDVGGVDLSRISVAAKWRYTDDHSKWAISNAEANAGGEGWICVADLNRQISQEKRGGGSICFKNRELWMALSSIEVEKMNS